MESAKRIWERALGELQIQVSRANYSTWLKNSQGISYQDNIFVVSVPNIFVAEWLSKHLYSLVKNTLTDIMGNAADVQFVVHNQHNLRASPIYANQADGGTSTKLRVDRFNSKYTFDNFVAGSPNRLAHAAAIDVAGSPGQVYNPLFIHSSAGQGKTHLLHAIGHTVASNGLQVSYTTAEQFTNEFILALRQKQIEDFHGKFRNAHTLLFDDFQFLVNKKQTLESFFHTFDELYSNNHQIVITADRAPKDMALTNNQKSRLEWGLVVCIQPPDFETRVAILRAKAGGIMPGLQESLQIIAGKIHDNVRQLEGALACLTAQAKLTGVNITPQMVNKLLTNTDKNQYRNFILQGVADYFNLSTEDLISKKRSKKIALARQIAMYLMREENSYSFVEIGKELGNRNHSTTLYGYEKIASELAINRSLYDQISEIRKTINSNKTV